MLQSQAQTLGGGRQQKHTVEDVQDWPEALQAVTPEEVVDAAKLVFEQGRGVTAYLTGTDEGL